ncbi:MAG: cytochrome c3 family protein [Phycisphaerales bacterium JB039]
MQGTTRRRGRGRIGLTLGAAAAWAGVLVGATSMRAGAGLAEAIDAADPRTPDRGHARSSVARCTACHLVEPALSHPVDVAPSMSVPAGLPLEDGRMTCLTCHELDTAGHGAARQQISASLRGTGSGAAWCDQCHQAAPASAAHDRAAIAPRAHLAWPGDRARGSADQLDDTETRRCLSCHDGSVAIDVAADQAQREHPVGIRYLRGRHGDGPPLVPQHLVDDRIRLFAGAVGCGTCHSPYSDRDDMLVMDNTASALCLSCHEY